MEAKGYYIHALSGLHMGTGQGTGVIDLPIAREKSTGLPIVPGSGVKGVLRDLCRPEPGDSNGYKKTWETLFGPEATELQDEKGFAGALAVQDAQLLCLPVRSVYGVFAWVSCPFILRRYQRDCLLVQKQDELAIPEPDNAKQALVTSEDCCLAGLVQDITQEQSTRKVILEDLTFTEQPSMEVANLAEEIGRKVFPGAEEDWQKFFRDRFMVVSDNVFSFLAETGTEIRARIKLQEDTRTVQKGGLWYEENLPAETILYGMLGCGRSRNPDNAAMDGNALLDYFIENMLKGLEVNIQIGGNATVGRGNVRWILAPEQGE